jgi:hypothetical protein
MMQFLRLFVAVYCCVCPAFAQSTGNLPSKIYSDTYGDLISRYWSGTPAAGAWITGYGGSQAALWEKSHLTNAVYAYWAITGSPDAAARITAFWTWVKNVEGSTALTTCGTTGTENFALDDTHTNVMLMLESYIVTGDSTALTWAKSAIDCAYARWSDGGVAGCAQASTPAGALWYDNTCAVKPLPANAGIALMTYWYYQLSGNATYRTEAINEDAWIYANLQRYPGQNGSTPGPSAITSLCPYTTNGPYVDGLNWSGINAGSSVPNGATSPCQIAEGGSVTSTAGNMSDSVLMARLYNDPLTSSGAKATYLARLILNSQGMRTYETGFGGPNAGALEGYATCLQTYGDRHQILINDADVGSGWVSYWYVNEVLPLVAGNAGVMTKDVFVRTANSIRSNARNPDGTLAASFLGPNDYASPSGCWYQGGDANAGYTIGQFSVVGPAMVVMFAGMAAQQP